MINVVIADDQELIRAGFRLMLDAQPDMTVVGEARDGAEAVARTRELGPDVVLMDVRMPELDGIEATRQLTADATVTARVLVLTTFDGDRHVYDAVRAGASGFLLKDVSPNQLVEAVRTVAAGAAVLSPMVTKRLLEQFVTMPPGDAGVPAPFDALSERELDVATRIAAGSTNAEIAAQMFLGESTVKTHVAAVLAKTGARDRIQVIVLAYETGLTRPGNSPLVTDP